VGGRGFDAPVGRAAVVDSTVARPQQQIGQPITLLL
jgi:hypothetical protein